MPTAPIIIAPPFDKLLQNPEYIEWVRINNIGTALGASSLNEELTEWSVTFYVKNEQGGLVLNETKTNILTRVETVTTTPAKKEWFTLG